MRKFMLATLVLWLTATGGEPPAAHAQKGAVAMPALSVTSQAFKNMQPLPGRYGCDGDDISPPLSWSGIPAEAASIALICDDPDAPRAAWVHWVAYDLPPTCKGLPEGVEKSKTLSTGGSQGKNDFQKIGYDGPCPPGGTHRYFFKVYALDTPLKLPPGKTRHEVEKAMKGHILAQGEIVGTYTGKRN
jgi:Raf kinase inhibitor-like YbhB/YbcL family protein